MSNKPTPSAHRHEFENKINNAVKNNIWHTKTFETLVKRQVVELGMELKCTKCSSWSWYPLKQLDDSLICDLCLKQFDFPVTSTVGSKHSRWAYRLLGPFALPDYARGGYAVALSISFFSWIICDPLHSSVTWSSGQELALLSGKQQEVDFVLWYQRKRVSEINYPTEVVFG